MHDLLSAPSKVAAAPSLPFRMHNISSIHMTRSETVTSTRVSLSALFLRATLGILSLALISRFFTSRRRFFRFDREEPIQSPLLFRSKHLCQFGCSRTHSVLTEMSIHPEFDDTMTHLKPLSLHRKSTRPSTSGAIHSIYVQHVHRDPQVNSPRGHPP